MALVDLPDTSIARAVIDAGDAWTEFALTMRQIFKANSVVTLKQGKKLANLAAAAVGAERQAYRAADLPIPPGLAVKQREDEFVRRVPLSPRSRPSDRVARYANNHPVVLQGLGFLSGEDDNSPGLLGESLEHSEPSIDHSVVVRSGWLAKPGPMDLVPTDATGAHACR